MVLNSAPQGFTLGFIPAPLRGLIQHPFVVPAQSDTWHPTPEATAFSDYESAIMI